MTPRKVLSSMALVLALALSAYGQGGSPITFFYGGPGEHATYALAINDVGQVAGLVADPFGGSPGLGMIYQGGKFTIFRYLGGSPTQRELTRVNSINNLGDTVGIFSSPQTFAAFLRRSDGTFVTLAPPAGVQELTPMGVNDLRQIVGTFVRGTVTHGFLTNRNGNYIHINFPGKGTGSENSGTFVTGINDLGQIVGYFTSTSTVARGFIFHHGTFKRVQCWSNGTAVPTQLLGINNRGQTLVACKGGYFVRDTNGHMTAVDDSSLSEPFVTALNDFGDVAGYSRQPDFPPSAEGFVIPGVVPPPF